MAGNLKVYQESIRMAEGFERSEDWINAVKAYRTALQEFPEDVAAISGIGRGYFELEQYASAVRAFQRALKVDPAKHKLWGYLGASLEALGRPEEAVKTYLYAGSTCAKAGDLETAIESWVKVTGIDAGNMLARSNLAQAYIRQERPKSAIIELVELAALQQEHNEDSKARQILHHALRLEPENRQLQAAVKALENGVSIRSMQAQINELARLEEQEGLASPASEEDDFLDLFGDFEEEDSEAMGNPREQGRQLAMEELANILFEDDQAYQGLSLSKMEIDLLVGQALEQQRRGQVDQAITTYEEIVQSGLRRGAVYFALALLFMRAEQYQQAVQYFNQAMAADKNYTLSAHFALGEVCQRSGDSKQALEHFINTLKLLDLDNKRAAESAGLEQLYDSIVDTFAHETDPKRTQSFLTALTRFLSEAEPQKKIAEARQFLSNGDQYPSVMALVEFLEAADTEGILSAMTTTNDYMNRNLLMTAGEECYRAIQKSPFYLPLHIRLADIYMKQDYIDSAIEKYMKVAEVYQIRGYFDQVAQIYHRILRVAPMDVTVRSRLIELHLSQGNFDGALNEYMTLADAYYQLAQVESALEKYKEALRLTSRASTPKRWQVDILHQMANIYDQRVDWTNASAAYEQILKLSPEDEQASLALVDLYFKLGRNKNAMALLDRTIGLYLRQGKQAQILEYLQDQTQLRPNEIILHERLASLYAKLDMKNEAIQQYDRLGEIQLESGLRDDAVRTIERILSLRPDDMAGYQQLLEKIKGSI